MKLAFRLEIYDEKNNSYIQKEASLINTYTNSKSQINDQQIEYESRPTKSSTIAKTNSIKI